MQLLIGKYKKKTLFLFGRSFSSAVNIFFLLFFFFDACFVEIWNYDLFGCVQYGISLLRHLFVHFIAFLFSFPFLNLKLKEELKSEKMLSFVRILMFGLKIEIKKKKRNEIKYFKWISKWKVKVKRSEADTLNLYKMFKWMFTRK